MLILTSSHLHQQHTTIKVVALRPLELILDHVKHSLLGMVETSLPSVIIIDLIRLARDWLGGMQRALIKSKVNVKVRYNVCIFKSFVRNVHESGQLWPKVK